MVEVSSRAAALRALGSGILRVVHLDLLDCNGLISNVSGSDLIGGNG
jgi:hypothetical protein